MSFSQGDRLTYLRLTTGIDRRIIPTGATFVRYQTQGRRQMAVIRVDDTYRDRVVSQHSIRPEDAA